MFDNDMKDWKENNLLLKSALLCNGIKENSFSQTLFGIFNPFFVKRTGNVGIHFKLGNHVVNASMHIADRFVSSGRDEAGSPFELRLTGQSKEHWGLYAYEELISLIELLPVPAWYHKNTSTGIPMGKVFLLEGGRNLMAALGMRCCYFKDNKQCRFCGYSGSNQPLLPSDFSETVCAAFEEDNSCTVTLTNGNSYESDRGALNYLPVINQIKCGIKNSPLGGNYDDIPIQIECAPPERTSLFNPLIDAGVNSFSINYECFDKQARQEVIPAKNEIPQAQYTDIWEYVLKKLGSGRVSSAVLFGIESPENTLKGAIWLINLGVRPNIIPFKPVYGSVFWKKPLPNYREYYEVCREVSDFLDKSGLVGSKNLGCSTCGGCNVEGDFYLP